MTRRNRLLLIALACLAALLLALAGALNWAWRSDSSLAWLLAQLPNAQMTGVRGSLTSGHLEIDRLIWQGGGARVQIDKLVLDGVEFGWHARALDARSASAQRVEVRTPPSTTPTAGPTDLRLPLTIAVAALRVAELQVDQAPAMHDLSARVALSAATHRIDRLALDVESMHISGEMQVATTGALTVRAALRAASTGARPWQAEAQAAGPLNRLGLTLALQGEATPGHAAPSASARATLAPFAPWPLAALTLATRQLDLAALSARLPETALDGDAQVQTSGLDQPANVQLTLVNTRPGRWDEARLPLQKITLDLKGEPRQRDRLQIESLLVQLADGRGPAGRATGRGQWQGDAARIELTLDALLPARLDARAAALTVSGPIDLRLAQLRGTPRFSLQAALQGRTLDGLGAPVQLKLEADGDADRLHLARALAESGPAQAAFSGDAKREPGGWRVSADARLDRFDPLPWWRGSEGSAWRRGPHRLSGQATLAGLWRSAAPAGFDGKLVAELADSLAAGVPLAAKLQWQGSGLAGSGDAWVDAGGNRIALDGRRAANPADDRWQLNVKAPVLATLAPLGRLLAEAEPSIAGWWPDAGRVDAEGQLQGRWPALAAQGQARIDGWRSRAAQLGHGTLAGRIDDNSADAPLALQLAARDLAVGGRTLDQLEAQIDGKLGAHTLRLRADSPVRPPAWTESLLGAAGSGTRLDGSARGAWTRQPGGGGQWAWQGLTLTGGARDAQGNSRPWLEARDLAGELALDADGALRTLHLAPGRVQLLSTALRWSDARWQADGQMTLAAELESINVAALLKQAQPTLGWSGDLTVGGRIDIRSAARVDADIVLERLGGDLAVTDEFGLTQALGLTDLRLALTAHDGVWQFAQGLAGRYIGEMAGAQVLRTGADQRWPGSDANLQGVLQARVANLGVWGAWVPPGWRLAGSLTTSAEFGGRLGAPELRGEMRGSGLGVRNLLQGVNVSDGELAITLRGERAEIERFTFKGGDGSLTLTGGALLGERPSTTLKLTAEHFRLLGRIDRRIVASGAADLVLDAEALKLNGRFAIDEGLIDVSHADAPSLDSDVVVRARAPGAAASAAPAAAASAAMAAPLPAPLRNAQVGLTVALGDKLQLHGRGLDTQLKGELRVASPGGRLALTGSVRAEGGTYAAYGQKLEISHGELVFSGAADNPRLDVLAVRPNLDVVVGVAITGSAQSPRIRLTSTPEMSDYDKLSWLVLGRSPDGLGRTDTALLQRAAVALLAGDGKAPTDNLLEQLGLTDFSVRQTDGDVRETIVSLGKQLSRRWYVGYERSVNATAGTWQLVYRVAQRFTLRAQSGNENALDLIWSLRW